MSKDFSKKLLCPGQGIVPTFKKNSKAVFHFRTIQPPSAHNVADLSSDTLPEGSKVIDDSRTMGTGPFELLIGREFKLSVWEELVRSMRVGEVARFLCPFEMVVEYPRVSKALRDLARQQAGESVSEQRTHTCSFSAMQGTGHQDLDSLNTTPLLFELELLQVEQPGEYKKEHWAMTEAEKDSAIPKLKEEGNALYKEGNYLKASDKYFEALSYLEEMCIKEKPESETWNEITEKKTPFLLNYAQCKLVLCEYAEVIRHTSSVLEFDGDNVKALFRRGKAHSGCWNVSEAREDLGRVVQLDPSLSKTVEKELQSLSSRVRDKELEERELLRGKLF